MTKLIWIFFGILTPVLAYRKGYNVFLWLVVGLVGGILGFLVIALLPHKALCPSCKKPVMPGTRFCTQCGAPMQNGGPLLCPSCGQESPSGANFCKNCGADLHAQPKQTAKPPINLSKNSRECPHCGSRLGQDRRRCQICNKETGYRY